VGALTQLLSFAMSISITRRAYYLGMALVALVESLVYGVALTALAAVERVTDGWGVGVAFWAPGPTADLNPALQVLAYAGRCWPAPAWAWPSVSSRSDGGRRACGP